MVCVYKTSLYIRWDMPLRLLIIPLLVLSACNKKTCVQQVANKIHFRNATSSPQTFTILVYNADTVENKTISLPASTETLETVLPPSSYQKEPHHHGKLDLSPKNPSCDLTETDKPPFQLADPQAAAVKLCHPFIVTIEGREPTHVVPLGQPCPPETTELKRW